MHTCTCTCNLPLAREFVPSEYYLSINGSLLSITRWMNDLFKKGYKQNLENSDIYQILPEEESEHLADRLER